MVIKWLVIAKLSTYIVYIIVLLFYFHVTTNVLFERTQHVWGIYGALAYTNKVLSRYLYAHLQHNKYNFNNLLITTYIMTCKGVYNFCLAFIIGKDIY